MLRAVSASSAMEAVHVALPPTLCFLAALPAVLPFWLMCRRERLRDQLLEKISRAVVALLDVEAEEACAICLEPCGTAKELQCQHHFHAECLTSWWWFSTKHTGVLDVKCPLCRRSNELEAV